MALIDKLFGKKEKTLSELTTAELRREEILLTKDRDKLFTRFGRVLTTANSHIPGIGLGLYFAREVARRAHARGRIERRPLRGDFLQLGRPVGHELIEGNRRRTHRDYPIPTAQLEVLSTLTSFVNLFVNNGRSEVWRRLERM